MKILWFSNGILSKKSSKGSGSWLHAMRDLISEEVELVNITSGSVPNVESNYGNGIREYILPNWKLHKGIPSDNNIYKIKEIVNSEQPDVIHIWGIERYWALLFSRGLIKHERVLLEMQGVAAGTYNMFWGGLTPTDCKKMRSIKTLLMPTKSVSYQYKRKKLSSEYESELLSHFNSVAAQSDWTRDQISFICKKGSSFYESLRPIRKEFYEAEKWKEPGNEAPVIYASFSYYVPYKGVHYLLKALSLLKKKYPQICLRIAGPNFYKYPFYMGGDYEKYLKNLIKECGLINNIHFCGSLNAAQIVDEIHHADVVVNPSLVESYSAAAAESLYLGAPTVLSYAGAMVNFSKDKPVALYYSPMDYYSLASRIITLIEDESIRISLISNAKDVMYDKCNSVKVKERQLETYKNIYKGIVTEV